MTLPVPGSGPVPPRPPIGAPTLAAAAQLQGARMAPPQGARRMPPVNRLQRTEFIPVPLWFAAPVNASHADWPIVELYARAALPAVGDHDEQGVDADVADEHERVR